MVVPLEEFNGYIPLITLVISLSVAAITGVKALYKHYTKMLKEQIEESIGKAHGDISRTLHDYDKRLSSTETSIKDIFEFFINRDKVSK